MHYRRQTIERVKKFISSLSDKTASKSIVLFYNANLIENNKNEKYIKKILENVCEF